MLDVGHSSATLILRLIRMNQAGLHVDDVVGQQVPVDHGQEGHGTQTGALEHRSLQRQELMTRDEAAGSVEQGRHTTRYWC